jgi:hypothetical protein
MAKEQFDFEELKGLKLSEYKKKYCKPAMFKAGKAGLFLYKFDIKARKKEAIYLSFKKPNLAKKAYEAIKADKSIHLVKRTALVSAQYGKDEEGKDTISLDILKGGLDADTIMASGEMMFAEEFQIKLNVTGTSEDIAVDLNGDGIINEEDGDRNQDGVIDSSTIQELKQKFQEAQQLYKQSKNLDKGAKVEALKEVSSRFKTLMPNLDRFISNCDQKPQLQTATKIKENIEKFQNALSGTATKGTENGTPKSNSKLDALTSGISKKAAQLLKNYQTEIETIDGLADKLKSISQLA